MFYAATSHCRQHSVHSARECLPEQHRVQPPLPSPPRYGELLRLSSQVNLVSNVRIDRLMEFFHRFKSLEFAASSITFITSAGCESIITWHDANSMVLAFILFAIKRSKSGCIVLSFFCYYVPGWFLFPGRFSAFIVKYGMRGGGLCCVN